MNAHGILVFGFSQIDNLYSDVNRAGQYILAVDSMRHVSFFQEFTQLSIRMDVDRLSNRTATAIPAPYYCLFSVVVHPAGVPFSVCSEKLQPPTTRDCQR